jgi:hypothetical protein
MHERVPRGRQRTKCYKSAGRRNRLSAADLAIRLADEGVPLLAIARIIRTPSAELRDFRRIAGTTT